MSRDLDPTHLQREQRVRFDWGATAAQALAADADIAVVVDVLSFTTTVSVATARGMTVHPFPWRDDRAAAFADSLGATLAVGRLEETLLDQRGVSLSPAAMSRVRGVDRILLPSPNGSTIASLLADAGATVVAASLRNATAVGRWVALEGGTVVIIAAGERWDDGSLRPGVEDLWGAGGVAAALVDAGITELSPEAWVAESAFRAVRGDLVTEMAGCASGLELIGKGFEDDVAMAAELDATDVVPVMTDGAFEGRLR